MTLEQIDLIVRRANPVPDASMLDPVDAPALLDQHRRTDMATLEHTPITDQPDKPRRPRWLAVAAAIVVAAAGVIIVMQRGGDSTNQPTVPTATTAPLATAPATTVLQDAADERSAVDIAQGFFDALATYDSATMEEYLSPDALARTYRDSDGLRLQLGWADAIGFKRTRDECVQVETSGAASIVRCSYLFDAIRSDEYGLGPFDGNYLTLTIGHFRFLKAVLLSRFPDVKLPVTRPEGGASKQEA